MTEAPQSYPDTASADLKDYFNPPRVKIAAYLLASYEDDTVAPPAKSLLDWGMLLVKSGMTAEHSGDCTKESHACSRCIADRALAHADVILGVAQAPLNDLIERCAHIAENGCLVPPDGGSPTVEEQELCSRIARVIRGLALPSTDRKPAPTGTCLNCGCPSDEWICGTCREMGCSISSNPRCTCAAIVNPNIPHARFCPLSSTDRGGK